MANVEIDVGAGDFLVSGSSTELDVGVIYTYWGWGSGEIIEWGSEEDIYITRAFSRNMDTTVFEYTAKTVALARNLQFDIDSTSIQIDAKDVNLSDVNISFDADTNSYTVTGLDVGLAVTYRLDAATDPFIVSGSDIGLLYSANIDLFADAAAYEVTGNAVTLEIGYSVLAATAAYTVTGTAVELDKGITLDADTASNVISGGAVTFPYTRSISADVSRYQVLGGDINLNIAGGITTFGKFDSTNDIKPENFSVLIPTESISDNTPTITTTITIPIQDQGIKA